MKTATKLLLLVLLAAAGCKERVEDTVQYTEDMSNGLRKKVSIGDLEYDILYKPSAYIVHKEHLPAAEAAKRVQDLHGTAWFNISFKVRDFNQSPLRYKVSGLEEYTARQDYYLNYAPKDIYLLYGADTLYVSSYWFENNQNLTLHETMVIGFRLPGQTAVPEQDMKLSFYDRIFENGIIKAVILRKDLENIQELPL